MAACPACGKELPGEFPFCPFCGAPLTEMAPASALEERKVVSVLFCDLVGFTAASEAADPEDVRARLRPYHARLREEIERYGGTVEKFVGDAVMAVFGAPVAHEDDAERAVRAGLRILEAIGELNEADAGLGLQVRVGINTGEAVVALGARLALGEGIVTGDVVNTASRLQAMAPVDGVAVSEATFRTTERVFEYEELEPVVVKGKAEPIALHRPLRARAQFGREVTRTHTTPLVGRELEKSLLVGMFERAAQQRSCQLVTLVGEPGVGKSRLCAELLRHVDDRPELVRWRQGRCLPYGEGIAFWALGEIVKAECGILESDSPESAEAKLERALPQDDPDLAWLRARLQPLVGIGGEPASQEESFAAWRRVLAGWAVGRETVLVFEDLHWADDALLSFLEHLADWAENVQLLVVCTARPELYERHRGWAGGLRNATTINLPALSDAETSSLVSSLLERAVLPAETQRVLLERAGGNPLYAEEFVRLLGDRTHFGEVVEVPESVQALIAARLDTLDADRKSLLQDASVVGKVFWAGALVEIGERDRQEVEQALHDLARKELVRPAASSSMDGDAEYAFWHVLVRDVCYQQIPRAARGARHQAAAAWLESRAGERIEDLADVLAHHYLTALELAQAGGEPSEANDLALRATDYLALAGERALGLDIAQAEALFGRAVELSNDAELERPELVVRWSEALLQAGRPREAAPLLEEALERFRERGETEATARVLIMLSRAAIGLGEQPRNLQLANDAVSVLEHGQGGALLVDAYTQVSNANQLAGEYQAAVTASDRALAIAKQLDLPLPAEALGWRGIARAYLNEYEGVAEAERALDLLIKAGSSAAIARLMNNLAIVRASFDGPVATIDAYERAIAFNRERGRSTVMISANRAEALIEAGRSHEALEAVRLLEADAETRGLMLPLMQFRMVEATCLTLHGEPALAHADWLLDFAREIGTTDSIMNVHPVLAAARLAAGQADQARALLLEIDATSDARTNPNYAPRLPGMVRTALAAGDPTLAKRLPNSLGPVNPLREHALQHARAQLAEADGNSAQAAKLYGDAAENWRKFGNVPERAYALLGQGRCLLASGDAGADAPLAEACDLFASMGYKPALNETEKLLAQAVKSTA